MDSLSSRQNIGASRALRVKDLKWVENDVAKSFENKQIRVPIHLSGGNEKQLVRIFKTIKKEDYVFSTHRNHYHYMLHTGDYSNLIAEILCEKGSASKGNCGSMHTIDHQHKFYSSAIVGGCVAIACGVGVALKLKGSDKHVWCFIGDGATDSGHTYEAIRYAIAQDLPVTYVIEDNDRSVATSIRDRWGKKDLLHPRRLVCSKVIYYKYKPIYPHVGIGKEISF